ncbi:hypothetical protein C8A01DRAFT_37829 [Parachaetomium inaequale]|uniref:F-box domain-containing protein n=1 Tax=Parachaetomium inaequale TaxID=2588326 RepID=A0AAN6PC59_9PEZI|nr:hypothetical protein C8A01DRAFT_37829 [Parachaetomium inaequale]
MAAVLTHLPPEILHSILSHVDPEDLGWLPLTCRALNNFIKGNNPLCRAIYLRILDEPPTKDLDFEQELHDIVTLQNLCSPKPDTPSQEIQSHLPFVHRTVTRLLNHAVTVPSSPPAKPHSSRHTTTPKPSTTSSTTTIVPNNSNNGESADPDTQFYHALTAFRDSLLARRESRARTFPVSRNAQFLTDLFDSGAARRNFLARSFLYERARAMPGGVGVDGFDGEDGEEHQLDSWGEVSGSETDSDDDDDGEGAAAGGRRRRPRRAFTAEWGWRRPRRVREAYQMSARLHCLYGWGLGFEDGVRPGATESEARRRALFVARQRGGVYALACAKVYDLREYTVANKWGPFRDGGEGEEGGRVKVRVDWEKVEAILLVLGGNIRCKGLERFPIFWHFWGKPFAGSWGGSYIPWSRDREQGKDGEMKELDRRDPYGVAGSWLRVVSFLDFTDFFHFNFPVNDRLPHDVPRPPLNAGQATRLILMRMRVAKVEPPGVGDHPDHPVTHFKGFSRALDGSWDDNADADIRGTVRVTPEGEVRWTSYSIFQGEERWKSEGVQIGGVRSARGVVGTWFDKDFNAQGPCGPTAFWKISDRENTGDGPQVLLEDLFPLIADDMDEELADDDDDSGDEFNLQVLDPFGPDWTGYELEDELDGLYHFDAEDIFDVEDLDGLEGVEEDDEDEDEDEEDGGEDEDEDEDDDDDLESAADLAHG